MNRYAVIVAGGSGSRMGSAVPKQFMLLRGKPVLWHTLNTFLSVDERLQVILVLPEAYMEAGRVLAAGFGQPGRIRLVAGGETRFHSVARGLALIGEEAVIAVHDGVRCLVGVDLVRRCFEQAARLGSAIPVVASKDSVRLITPTGSEPLDRSRVKLVQTPQTFLSDILLPAYQARYRDTFTDEATVVEAAGHTVHLIDGDAGNIKITLPGDLLLAERLLAGE
ncbi:MAG TPA: 2-C-methyl-D-erythritol 4-phosphate cytidylyltransferase [Puia sp.]|nr:2-C-methyl-D-erythritol 4-phosphate cytidylyltransferase [Puia sp.]